MRAGLLTVGGIMDPQHALPCMDTEDGLSPYTGAAPLSRDDLRVEMLESLKIGDLERVTQIEKLSAFDWAFTMARFQIGPDGCALEAGHSIYSMPVASRALLASRVPWPEAFHVHLAEQLLRDRKAGAFRLYCDRPSEDCAGMDAAARRIGGSNPVGAVLWAAEHGMPPLKLMTGAMQNANVGVLLKLIDHLERYPLPNPHLIGMWLEKNRLPAWWRGSPAIEGRLKKLMFKGPDKTPKVAPAANAMHFSESFEGG